MPRRASASLAAQREHATDVGRQDDGKTSAHQITIRCDFAPTRKNAAKSSAVGQRHSAAADAEHQQRAATDSMKAVPAALSMLVGSHSSMCRSVARDATPDT